MQTRTKQRRSQKENDEFQSFHIKTKQYTNKTAASSVANTDESSYSPKQTPKMQHFNQHDYHASSWFDKGENISFKQRYNLEGNPTPPAPLGIYHQNTFEKSEVGKISRNNNLDVDYRRYLKDNVSKSPIKKEITQNSFQVNSKLLEISHSQSFKKDTAKKKGLQMKMTNIDIISDQISSLLNMVNKSKKPADNSNSKSVNKFQQKAYNKQDSLQKYKPKNNKSPLKNVSYQPNNKYPMRQNRERVYSDLNNEFREQFDSIKFQNKKYGACNQEENRWMDEPATNYKYQPKSYHNNQKYLQNQNKSLQRNTSPYPRQTNKSPYNHKKDAYSPSPSQYDKHISPYRNSNKNYQQTNHYDQTPKKIYENFDKLQTSNGEWREDRGYAEYTPKYIKNKQRAGQPQNQLLPLSIQKNYLQRKPKNAERQEMGIQQHLKKLKGKVLQSEQKNYRYQQKLKDRQYDLSNQQKQSGKLMKRNSQKSQFELKIYPVQNDRPNTVKVAEKMAEQIEIDQKLTLPRIQFQKQQDQYKWSQIELSLKAKQMKMTKFQIQKLIQLSHQQMDNFNGYQVKSSNGRKNIADLLFQAQKHWQREVYGCASMKGLKAQLFNPQSLALHDGYVSLQDLTSFVNTYTGRRYNNRDLIMVYRRLQLLEGSKDNERIQFGTLVRAIAI